MAAKVSTGQAERPTGGKGRRGRDPRKDAGIVATIAAGGHVKDAAAAAGVSERTAWRRLSDPDVAREIADARAVIAAGVLTRAATHATAAVDTLAAIMADKKQPAAARIAAARAILAAAGTYGLAAETTARLEALEDAARPGELALRVRYGEAILTPAEAIAIARRRRMLEAGEGSGG